MRDVDWRMCLRCMSEGEDGRPMVAPTFIAGTAIKFVGAGIAARLSQSSPHLVGADDLIGPYK